MPGKPRHDKKKHSHLSKKSRAIQRTAAPAPQPAVTKTSPSPAASAPAPHASPAPAPAATVRTKLYQEYPFIMGELRTIGVLALATVIILVILALTLN